MSISGGQFTGKISVKNGNYSPAGIFSDGEGGNIWWNAPDGSHNELDSYNNTRTRIYAQPTDGSIHGLEWSRYRDYNLDYLGYWPGDSIYVNLCCGGFITNNKTHVMWNLPLDKPLIGVSGLTWTNIERFEIRQNGAYLTQNWSAATGREYTFGTHGIRVRDYYSNIGGTNNCECAMWVVGWATFY